MLSSLLLITDGNTALQQGKVIQISYYLQVCSIEAVGHFKCLYITLSEDCGGLSIRSRSDCSSNR